MKSLFPGKHRIKSSKDKALKNARKAGNTEESEPSSPVCFIGKEQFREGFGDISRRNSKEQTEDQQH